jgi:hypothetical protein
VQPRLLRQQVVQEVQWAVHPHQQAALAKHRAVWPRLLDEQAALKGQ